MSSISLPLLPLRESVLLLHMEYPIVAARTKSIAAIEAALMSEDKTLIVVAQRDNSIDNPQQEELYTVGTRALIRKMERLPNNSISATLRGLERVEIKELDSNQAFLQAEFQSLPLPTDASDEIEALHREVLDQATVLDSLVASKLPKGLLPQMLESMDDPLGQVFLLCAFLKLDLKQQQEIHEVRSRLQGLQLIHQHLDHEIQILSLQQEIAQQAAANVTKEQRNHMLRRQLEEIQKELGEKSPEQTELDALREKLDKAELPEAVDKVAIQELDHLQRLSPAAQDYQTVRTYLELILELPWNQSTQHELKLAQARDILDADHFDLSEVKDRIIEHLAIHKLNPKSRGAILCFVGGPGVGKTSLGASIARSLGRKFERISLGGLHDEAELRGHRKTYVGAMPGRIIQAIKRTQVNNPVIMLDEVDKLGRDYRGDPAAALMEILDPSQNKEFYDNYLNLPFDLSNVFFVATANTLDTIPRPLLDRMEVLRLSGYTEEEKVQIAVRYLVPRQISEVNLSGDDITIPEKTLQQVIRGYTREAGVRELDRQVASLVRKTAIHFAEGKHDPVCIDAEQISPLLGPELFFPEQLRGELKPGVSTGLAWTEAGGDVLYIESVIIPGNRGLTLTGQLGEVMKESAQAAQSYIMSQADSLKIDISILKDSGIHVHVPAGAIPKDGPSAGLTIATSLASLLTDRPVRSDTAMTGEITLAGLILPVGGIKEKVLAARRSGIRRIILPAANVKDLAKLDEGVRAEIEFIPVSRLQDVFIAALDK